MDDLSEEPANFMCSISGAIMEDPVVAADGLSYERVMIETWLKAGHNTSPRTNAVLAHTYLTPNIDLRVIIHDWREKQTASIAPEKITVDESEAGVLGKGAWSVVRKGTFRYGRQILPVAIKTIPDADTTAEEVAKMFATEIKIFKFASFRCLHTAKLYGTTIKNGRLCIVMKLYYCTLSELITSGSNGKLALDAALRHGVALFRALAELHAADIVSRDIKPENILFDEYGSLVISDFGISLQGQVYVPQKEVKGTFNYMSPELFGDDVEIDGKVDVWAGACCITQMITGIMPFTGSNFGHIMNKVRVKKEMPPEASSPDIPVDIKTIVHKCLHFDPKSRPTATVVLAELETLYHILYISDTPQKVLLINTNIYKLTLSPHPHSSLKKYYLPNTGKHLYSYIAIFYVFIRI